MTARYRIAIIHPWLPGYRLPFFDALTTAGERSEFDIDVFHGPPPPEVAARADSVTATKYRQLRTITIPVGSRSLNSKSLEDIRRNYDLVVVEQALRNLETYRLLLSRDERIAFWGHGRTYTKHEGRLARSLKASLTRRGAWFFAYTEGGRDTVVAQGFPADRVTVLSNTIDTTALKGHLASVTDDQVEALRQDLNLGEMTVLTMGGLDSSKRLDFLLDSADRVSSEIPDFRLLIAGDGDQREWLRKECRSRAYIRMLGPVSAGRKALAMRASKLLLNPGRVGLIAVDSFAAGLPIITTDWPYHAPEFEYLNDENSVIAANTPIAFAGAVIQTLQSPTRLATLRAGATSSAGNLTVESMAEAFLFGLRELFCTQSNPSSL